MNATFRIQSKLFILQQPRLEFFFELKFMEWIVLSGRKLPGKDPAAFVSLKLGDQSYKTSVQKSAAPVWDETAAFDL